jgi:hypothetical protein
VTRFTATAFLLAVGAAFVTMPPASAQSPNPALLAPGHSGRMLASPHSVSRSSYGSATPRNVFRSYRSLTGASLSHPSTHIH